MVMGALLGPLMPIITKVLDLIPDPNAKAQAQAAFEQAAQSAEVQELLAQIEVNKAEAGSSNIFVAGWRPFIGWVCGASLVWQFIGAPVFGWVSGMFHGPQPPMIDTSALMTLLLSMLGVGAMRTVEKVQGVAAAQSPASRAAAVARK